MRKKELQYRVEKLETLVQYMIGTVLFSNKVEVNRLAVLAGRELHHLCTICDKEHDPGHCEQGATGV